jgi:predicted O-methyltransferase YrrM
VHSRDFDEVADDASTIPGWLTREQARVLFDEAAAVPAGGCVVEIGSHYGRSTLVLASAVTPSARVVAVDPFPTDWRYGGPNTEQALRDTLASAGLTEVVDVRVGTSAEVLAGWKTPVDVVYVDGKHDARSVCHDLRWGRWVAAGGHVLVHDAFSSVGVTLGLVWTLLTGRNLVYVDRTGSLARLRVGQPSVRDRLRSLRELPWWLRNVFIKVLLRLRLRRVARWWGHTDEADPY